MKILQCFTIADKQTGLFILRAFKELGHYVEVVDSKKEPERTASVCDKMRPDLVFCSRELGLLSPVKYIRKKYPSIKTVCWNVDKRDTVKQFKGLLSLFNSVHIFYTIAKGNIPEYKKLCPNTIVKHLQQGTDLTSYGEQHVSDEDHSKYDCDIMFAGALNPIHKDRKEIVLHLKNRFNMKIFGADGRNRILDTEHSKACRCTKICLSHNGWPNISCSSSFRIYKIISAGGFCLEQNSEGMSDFFDGGLITYTTKEDCEKKVRYYLDNEDERKENVVSMQKLVCEKHRYIDRMKTVINDISTLE